MSKTVKNAKEEGILDFKNARKTKQTLGRLLNSRKKNHTLGFPQTELRGYVPGHDMDDWL